MRSPDPSQLVCSPGLLLVVSAGLLLTKRSKLPTKYLQERTFIYFPNNLVHWFALLTFGNILVTPSVPFCDLRPTQLVFN